MSVIKEVSDILKLFTDNKILQGNRGLSFTDIMTTLGLAKSTTSRLLSLMENYQLLERDPDNRLYQVGSIVLSASSHYLSSPLIEMASPYIERLSREVQCTGYISVLEGIHVKVMRMFPGTQALQVVMPVGSILPAAELALGRMLLARKSDLEIRELYGKNYQVTSKRAPQTLDELLDVVTVLRRQKWSFACNECLQGVSAIATSLFNKHRNEMIGLCLAAPAQIDCALFPEESIELLVKLTHQLSEKLANAS